MNKENKDLSDISESYMLNMINNTSELVAKFNTNTIYSPIIASKNSNDLVNSVEFWKWMDRNYSKSEIFKNNETMKQYISQGIGKEEWIAKQLQGKGYEWDWMKVQRESIKNILKTYDAGDIANRAASDVTEKNLLTSEIKEYQMKAYISKSNPDLHNTPKDMTIVTNSEKVKSVKMDGYENVQKFKNARGINESTRERLNQIKDGNVNTSYNIKNITNTMSKSAIMGCVIGIGTETVKSYRLWEKGELTDEEYLKEILKSGGDAGVTSSATAGIMIPVSAKITALGMSTLLTIPVAFAIGGVVNKIVAPCFAKGEYKNNLLNAKYYQNIENIYDDLVDSMKNALYEYDDFIINITKQNEIYKELKRKSMRVNKDLKNLYDSI